MQEPTQPMKEATACPIPIKVKAGEVIRIKADTESVEQCAKCSKRKKTCKLNNIRGKCLLSD